MVEAMLQANMLKVRLKRPRLLRGSAMGHGGCRAIAWIQAEAEMTQTQLEAWRASKPKGDGSLVAWTLLP